MPRPKYSNAYPQSYRTIMESVANTGQPFEFPPQFSGYTAAGLRATFQAYLRCLVVESEREPHNELKRDLRAQAQLCIVRIQNDQVVVANRTKDKVELELQALLASRGIKSELDKSMERVFGQSESPAPPALELVEPDPELAPTCTCGGYGCPVCDPVPDHTPPHREVDAIVDIMQQTAPAPAPTEQTQDQKLQDMTKRWLGK